MKISADYEGSVRRFTARLGRRESFDFRAIDLLSGGTLPALIPPLAVQGKRNDTIQFDISEYSTLEFYLSGILDRNQLSGLLVRCADAFRMTAQARLDPSNLVLEPDKVYIRLSDRSVHFIFLPLRERRRASSVPGFFQAVLEKAVRGSPEQAACIDACQRALRSMRFFDLEAFARVAAGVREERPASPPPAPADSDGETCLLFSGGGREETMLLGGRGMPAERYCLTRVQTGERITLAPFPFLVGTEFGSVAYFVSGNSAVSRRHAQFSLEGGSCCVADQRSTNRTYVNDQALEPYVSRPLQNGDRIRLGNEEFVFTVEPV